MVDELWEVVVRCGGMVGGSVIATPLATAMFLEFLCSPSQNIPSFPPR